MKGKGAKMLAKHLEMMDEEGYSEEGEEGGEEAGFAGVGEADQPDVGDGFQDEYELAGFPGLAILRVARCLPDGAGKAGVAASPAPAPA